jgi:cyclopropane-fatty-acyl-phospholipid synthase
VPEGYIDPERWPALVGQPDAALLGRRAEKLRARLEELTRRNGVALTRGASPRFVVEDGVVLDRAVAGGWLGLAEGFMAGEWTAEPLPEVLRVLLSQPLEAGIGGRLARRRHQDFGQVRSGELPDALVGIYTGDTRATGSALFASGTKTSETVTVTQHGHPTPVVTTWMDAPAGLERADLDAAQLNRIGHMLDLAKVGPGDRVLELTSSGGALPVVAARRGARVDVLTSDADHAEVVRERAHEAGVGGAVNVQTIRGPVPSPRQWSGAYEAVFSVERMETLGDEGTLHYLRAAERMLAPRGTAVIQSVTTSGPEAQGGRQARQTREEQATVDGSLDVMRAYVWPALRYPTVQHVRTAAEKAGLTLTREIHLGSHMERTLALWRSAFTARERSAAAAGFDPVYRRLWTYQLALHEALVGAGELDCVEFVFRRRP